MSFSIRQALAADFPAIRHIYLAGLATKNASFQTACPPWKEWQEKMEVTYVYVENEEIRGWTSWSAGHFQPLCIWGRERGECVHRH